MKEVFQESDQNFDISERGNDAMSDSEKIKKIGEIIGEKGLLELLKILPVETVTKENEETFENQWKKIWDEEGYFGKDKKTVIDRYKSYNDISTDIISATNPAVFGKKENVGTIRLIWNKEKGIPALNDFKIKPEYEWLKEENCAEFTLLTVEEKWRKRELMHIPALVLYREACRQIIENGKTNNILLITNTKRRDAMQNHMGFVLHKISEEEPEAKKEEGKRDGEREEGEKWYEGEYCASYYIDYKESLENLKKTNPYLYEFFKI